MRLQEIASFLPRAASASISGSHGPVRRRSAMALTALVAAVLFSFAAVQPALADAASDSSRTVSHTVASTLPSETSVAANGGVAAQAASSCGNACDGKDPASYVWNGSTCSSDAVTIYTLQQSGYYAELRYSPRCVTAWTRTCCGLRAAGFGYRADGSLRSAVYNYDGSYTSDPVWTAMLNDYGTFTYKACFDHVLAGSGHDWACTSTF